MATWSRRLSAAQAKQPQAHKARVELPASLPKGVSAEDETALRSLGALARDHVGFHAELTVEVDGADPLHVMVDHEDGQAMFTVGGEQAAVSSGSASYEDQIDSLLSGGRVVDLMSDALVITPDPVAIFASVGAEAL